MQPVLLLAEDNDDLRDIFVMIAERMEFVIHAFPDAQEAWAWLQDQSQSPDLILSDNDMPVMQGTDFLDRVRAHPLHNNSKFVLMSGGGDLTEFCKLRNAVFQDKGNLIARELLLKFLVKK